MRGSVSCFEPPGPGLLVGLQQMRNSDIPGKKYLSARMKASLSFLAHFHPLLRDKKKGFHKELERGKDGFYIPVERETLSRTVFIVFNATINFAFS